MNYAKVSYLSFKVYYFPKLKNTIVEADIKSFFVYLKKIVYKNKNPIEILCSLDKIEIIFKNDILHFVLNIFNLQKI